MPCNEGLEIYRREFSGLNTLQIKAYQKNLWWHADRRPYEYKVTFFLWRI